MGAFVGMRGTGDWVNDQRPLDWRETMLFLYPNGKMPLTGIMSKQKKEATTDAEFNWWTKNLAGQAGDITNIYTDSAMTSAYTSGGVDGTVLYVKVAEATALEIRKGHKVVLRDASHMDVDVIAKVLESLPNGASSRITVKLMEADDNGASTDLSDADRICIIGNINAEGAVMPDAISYDPVKYSNYCGIQRTPLEITRTARKTKLRTPDQYKEAKREALEIHGMEQEKDLIWSIPYEGTGENGKPERSSGGLNYWINTYASGNVSTYNTETDWAGQTWLEGGEDWLDTKLEVMFRYGTGEKLAICGSEVILQINKLVKASGNFELKATSMAYGIDVVKWITGFGAIYLKTHPLLSYETTTRNLMFIVEPQNMVWRYIDDTFFKADDSEKKGGPIGKDGTAEEFLTEGGYEFHYPEAFGKLDGFGITNTA